MPADLTDTDKADPRRAAARHDRRRPLPDVAAGAPVESDPGEARSATGRRAAAATEGAGRAELGAEEEASTVSGGAVTLGEVADRMAMLEVTATSETDGAPGLDRRGFARPLQAHS